MPLLGTLTTGNWRGNNIYVHVPGFSNYLIILTNRFHWYSHDFLKHSKVALILQAVLQFSLEISACNE